MIYIIFAGVLLFSTRNAFEYGICTCIRLPSCGDELLSYHFTAAASRMDRHIERASSRVEFRPPLSSDSRTKETHGHDSDIMKWLSTRIPTRDSLVSISFPLTFPIRPPSQDWYANDMKLLSATRISNVPNQTTYCMMSVIIKHLLIV